MRSASMRHRLSRR